MWGICGRGVILATILLALVFGFGCSRDSGGSEAGVDSGSGFRNLGKR